MDHWDFTDDLMEAFLKHLDHLFHCPICSNRLADLVRDAQNHEPELLKAGKSNHK